MNLTFSLSFIRILLILIVAFPAYGTPKVAFSDLISGPSVGLNDGKGIGAIVTLWGYNFGSNPGNVIVVDSTGQRRPASHIYYWKEADGKLPGGPSQLYDSHKLFELAFSLPESADGAAQLIVQSTSGELSDPYQFTIRQGSIYHVKPSGNNATGDGSFENPWAFINGWNSSSPAPGNAGLKPGDVVYSHGVKEPSFSGGGTDAGMYLRSLAGTLEKQIAFSSYPDTHAVVESPRWGVHPYLSSGIVVSKFIVKGGSLDDPMDNSATFGALSPSDSTLQVKTSENGRIIGNFMTDSEGKCSNGWHGAISGGGLGVSNVKAFGNYIFDIGCKQTSHFHHTTYMSKRQAEGAAPSEAWEFGWNHLRDNKAKFGIHFYDQSPFDSRNCADVVGTLKVHHNYIVNQRGTGINVRTSDADGAGDCWSANVEVNNNILINTGLGPVSEINNGTSPYGIQLGGDISGGFIATNNLIFKVSDESSREYADAAAITFQPKNKNASSLLARNIIDIPDPGFKITLVSSNDAVTIVDNVFKRTGVDLSKSPDTHFPKTFSIADNYLEDPGLKLEGSYIYYKIFTPKTQIQSSAYQTFPSSPVAIDFFGNGPNESYIGPINISGTLSEALSPPTPPDNILVD
ncbi:MAG: hypothetical protein ACN2B6_11520 [Rickettsiales bacterium]